jgi:hypothetical protein
MRFVLSTLAFVISTNLAFGQSASSENPMTAGRLTDIILEIDTDANVIRNTIELTIEGIPILIVVSEQADRMRAMVPISSAEGLSEEDMSRVLQANFDSALDARYAIAQGKLWSVFIHPLSPLERDQFLSGLVQTINVARTYGQSYSGGAVVFGGGDSNGIYQELFETLRKKGQAL